jgi:hypothetical protein
LQKISNENSKEKQKEKGKKIRKRQKGHGEPFGLARESAHGPSSLTFRIGTKPPLSNR